MINQCVIHINGDGETSRDFCYIDNVVQVNVLAATATHLTGTSEVFNVAVGDRTTLNDLYKGIKDALCAHGYTYSGNPVHREFRAGDVRHSQADISKAKTLLGYQPSHRLLEGIAEAMKWYASKGVAINS